MNGGFSAEAIWVVFLPVVETVFPGFSAVWLASCELRHQTPIYMLDAQESRLYNLWRNDASTLTIASRPVLFEGFGPSVTFSQYLLIKVRFCRT